MDTYFAPAERADKADLAAKAEVVQKSLLFQGILESLDDYILVLNRQRQAVAFNRRVYEDLGVDASTCLEGRRPGELLDCVFASEGPNGCGTAKACSTCGAVLAILECQRCGAPVTAECLARVRRGDHEDSAEFRVRATPLVVDDYVFTVLVLHDISAEKRRSALERTFFHDIANTIGGLVGWVYLLEHDQAGNPKEAAQWIGKLASRLTDELREHRMLLQAEQGALELNVADSKVSDLMLVLKNTFAMHDVSKGRTLEFGGLDSAETVNTDSTLLLRILTNMIKNALEASQPGETVRVRFERVNGAPRFAVQNPGVIPDDVAMQIFKRSFSTKGGSGRGIGTYSMKLFGERYLGGKVSFRSVIGEGTTFQIELPS